MDQADTAVWQEVCRLLEDPQRLEQEYRQRLQPKPQPEEHEGMLAQINKLRRGITRLIDSYADGLIDKTEFEPRVTRLRERMQHLEEQVQRLKEDSEVEEELRVILSRLETFAAKVQDRLHQADFQTRRDIIRALVKRVEVDEQQIRIVFRVSPTSLLSSSDEASHNWQDCGRRVHARRLEGNMGTSSFFEPIPKLEQLFRCGEIRPKFFLALTIGQVCHDAHFHRLLMHVQSCAGRVEDFHSNTPGLFFLLVKGCSNEDRQKRRFSSACC